MILGRLQHVGPETAYLPAIFQTAFAYLQETDFFVLENKKYLLRGEDLFVVISEYVTKPHAELKAEAHQKYLDIHYVVSGEESIGVGAPNEANELLEGYNPEIDAMFYRVLKNESIIALSAGDYAVFFPPDIHRPGGHARQATTVRKAVVKISMGLLNR